VSLHNGLKKRRLMLMPNFFLKGRIRRYREELYRLDTRR
jgi:hypothetical protein